MLETVALPKESEDLLQLKLSGAARRLHLCAVVSDAVEIAAFLRIPKNHVI